MDVDFPIPKLRQDLKIYKGGHEKDGSPTWMLYDPLSDNYFKIGWFEFECLSRIEKYSSMFDLAKAIGEELPLSPDREDVFEFITFLISNNLCQATDPVVQNFLLNQEDVKKSSFFLTLFSKYIYTQFPLFSPKRMLEALYPFVSFFLTKGFVFFMLALLILGAILTVQRFDEFIISFTSFTSLDGVMMIIISTIIVKSFHELGHAFVAHKYNVPVTTIGVAFIVAYPVLYTETTNSWRLYDRKKRSYITMAGVMAELYLAAIALILWHVLSPGLAQNMAFFVAVVSLGASIFINANPLMKFDGYYLACDLTGFDNLQIRAIAFFKWKLKQILFSVDDDPPEILEKQSEYFLIGFGVALAIYRFFLYLGIALLLYHVFFKPLGFILMLLEISWFIAFPVFREIRSWYSDRMRLLSNQRPKYILGTLILLFFVFFFPVQRTVKIPAVIHAGEYSSLYSPTIAKVKDIKVRDGDLVHEGDILFVLESEQLENNIKEVQAEIRLYEVLSAREQLVSSENSYDSTYEEKILELKEKLNGFELQKNQLVLRSTHSGKVQDLNLLVHDGRWVGPDTLLGRVIGTGDLMLSGYVSEKSVVRLKRGAEGSFRFKSALFESIPVQLVSSFEHNTKNISHAELSSVYGGDLAADLDAEKGVSAKETLYVLKFSVSDKINRDLPYTRQGTVYLRGDSQVPAILLSKKIIALFLHEMGG